MIAQHDQWTQEIVEIIPDIRRWIHRFTGNHDDTDEILQQTLIKALENLAGFAEPFNMKAWLMTIARNQSMTYLKARNRTTHAGSLFLERNTPTLPLESVEQSEVVESMRNLSSRSQQLLFMKYFTHHKVSELSQLLRSPEGSVKRWLHEARNELRKEIEMSDETPRTAPVIKIEEVKTPQQQTIRRAGYGLFFGAPLKGVGDVEIVEGYEHPGRIHTFEAHCKVTRKVTMLGHEVWEAHNTYSKRDGEKERFLYYTIEDGVIGMPFRVFHYSEPDEVRIDIEREELVGPQPLDVTAPSCDENDDRVEERSVVHVTIDGVRHENCIRVRELENDVHGRSYTESYINQDGREVLHHSYISEGWKMGGFVTWEKWKDAPETTFRGEKFRLWFEFILIDAQHETD